MADQSQLGANGRLSSIVEQWFRTVGRGAFSYLASISTFLRRLPGLDRERRPLYRSSLLDDVLFAQPLNTLFRFERFRALRSNSVISPGSITVVIVNFNTRDVLATTIEAVQAMSPSDVRILVVDNASTDGSREWLREHSAELDAILLPTNVGHGRALDLGFFRARTELVVTLDSDAFPYSRDWIDRLVRPLGSSVVAVGWNGRRDRLHPCCAVYRRDVVLNLGLSFGNFNIASDGPAVFGVSTWDTGELISEALGPGRFELIDNWSTEFGGMVMGDVVYHHCGVTTLITDEEDLRRGTSHSETWNRAVEAYLGAGWKGLRPLGDGQDFGD